MHRTWSARRLTSLFFVPLLWMTPVGCVSAQHAPALNRSLPDFRLMDLDGTPRTVLALRGRPIVLLFFCGCRPCHETARYWRQVQAGGTLEAAPARGKRVPAKIARPAVLVVFLGDSETARAFAAETGLDTTTVSVLPDAEMEVARAYDALECPRAFVADAKGVLRYTNAAPGDTKHAVSPSALVARIVAALRAQPPSSGRPSHPARKSGAHAP